MRLFLAIFLEDIITGLGYLIPHLEKDFLVDIILISIDNKNPG